MSVRCQCRFPLQPVTFDLLIGTTDSFKVSPAYVSWLPSSEGVIDLLSRRDFEDAGSSRADEQVQTDGLGLPADGQLSQASDPSSLNRVLRFGLETALRSGDALGVRNSCVAVLPGFVDCPNRPKLRSNQLVRYRTDTAPELTQAAHPLRPPTTQSTHAWTVEIS